MTRRTIRPVVSRIIGMLLWSGILGIIAVRPWALDRPDAVPIVEQIGLWIGGLWCLSRLRHHLRIPAPLLIPCLCLLLAFFFSRSRGTDLQAASLQGYGLALGIMLCLSVLLADHAQRWQLQLVLTVTGVLLSLYAVWQRVVLFPGLSDFPWEQLVTTEPWRAIPVHTAEFAATVVARRRVFGPFPLPGLLATALVMLLPMSVNTLKGWTTTPARWLVASVVWSLQATALLMTQSLGGISSAGVATLMVLAPRHDRRRLALCVLGATLVAVGTLLVLRPELSQRAHPRNPMAQRWRYWMSTVEMIRDHPVRGVGAGNYASVYPRYQRPLAMETRFAHNALLHVWAEWGLLGAIGIAALVIGSLRLVARAGPERQIAVWAFWLMALIDIAWSVPQLTMLWWPVLGLAVAPESVGIDDEVPRGAQAPSARAGPVRS